MGILGLLAVLTWLVALYRVPRPRSTSGDWPLAATLAALGLGLTLKVPPVYDLVGRVGATPNLGQLVKNGAVVLSAFGTQVVLLRLLQPRAQAAARVRRRTPAPVLALVAMTVAFLLADTGRTEVYLNDHLAAPGLLEYRIVYLAFLVWAFVDIARICWRFARLAGDRTLTWGLRLIAAGGVIGLGYVVAETVQVVASAEDDLGLIHRLQSVSDGLVALATLLVILGSTLPAVVGRFRGSDDAPDGLDTLWRALTAAVPDVVLQTAASDEQQPEERRYRQVIEVEDARSELRPLRTPLLQAAATEAVLAHGTPPGERTAAIEGVVLALAVRRLGSAAPTPRPSSPVLTHPAAGTLEEEVTWLSRVGYWFADERLVDAADRHLSVERGSRDQAR